MLFIEYLKGKYFKSTSIYFHYSSTHQEFHPSPSTQNGQLRKTNKLSVEAINANCVKLNSRVT